ncbi:MAG TPA: GAF domain-containing protein [Gemmatimonadaceae bacterium]|nr:GAF domain-containing protein [Gemmatimonadaceae bacterium]
MAPRTLPQLAHALHVAPTLDAALVALGEALLEIDRSASVALFRYNGRRGLLQDRLTPAGNRIVREAVDTRLDHLPPAALAAVGASTEFVELGERSGEYLRLLGWANVSPDAALAVRGLRVDGQLAAVLALVEPRKFFGARTTERFAPAVALFDLAFGRFADRDARAEAVRTLEDVTQRVHGEYVRRLGEMERALDEARGVADRLPEARAAAQVAVERAEAQAAEEVRRARHRATQFEEQLGAAVGQLEQAHVELHRRSEALRQRTRTLYLLDRVLTLDAETRDARQLVDGLLALVGDDMQAQRCSLLLRAPEPNVLYLAAARGLAPHVLHGARVTVGQGVAGKVAASRQPLLVQDVEEAHAHPLLRDQYFTTGSFISFPLEYHGELVGVVNLTNRAQRGVFTEEDVERVRLLALVISLIASHARLSERLLVEMHVR